MMFERLLEFLFGKKCVEGRGCSHHYTHDHAYELIVPSLRDQVCAHEIWLWHGDLGIPTVRYYETTKCCWCGALSKRDRESWEGSNMPASVQTEIDALMNDQSRGR